MQCKDEVLGGGVWRCGGCGGVGGGLVLITPKASACG